MKLIFILLTAVALHASAKGFTQAITLSVKDAPLEKVFESITNQSGFRFFYNEEQLQKSRPVTINIKETSIEEALNICLKDQPLTYTIVNKVIVIKTLNKAGALQLSPSEEDKNEAVPIDVKGKVTNEKGDPAIGVTVTIKGTNIATSTDAKGEFSLSSVDREAVLVFTSVNMETFELKVNGKTELMISLKTKITSLGNVEIRINTGYQQITGDRFIGSYSQLDSQNFHRRVGMNIIERLDGTVPGILFNKKGSTGVSPIQIRGISTLGINGTATDPLIVVDNFPMPPLFDINNINPNDVESVTVLKDAAAASIWGSRAGNGVIVITTKKGKFNQKFQLNVSSNVTIESKIDQYYVPRVSPSDFIDIERSLFSKGFYDAQVNNTDDRPVISPVVEILAREAAGTITPSEATSQINALRNYDVRKDLDKYIYRNALRQQHFIEFTGGTNNLAYQFSFGYDHNLNNIQKSKADQKFTIAANTSFQVTKNLEIQTGIDLALSSIRGNNFELPPLLFPYSRFADDNGNSLAIPYQYRMGYIDTAGAGNLLDWHYRPIDEIGLTNNHSATKFMTLNIGLNYRLTSWLKANLSYQYQNTYTNIRDYKSPQAWTSRDLVNQFTNPDHSDPNLQHPIPRGGILDLTNYQGQNYHIRGTLSFNKNFNGIHQVNALIAGEISDSKGGYSSSQRFYGYDDQTGFYQSYIDYYNLFPRIYSAYQGDMAFIPNNSGYSQLAINRFVSMLANASYVYNNRYSLYVSARRDGANVFGVTTNNKWKPLWSAGAGWEISRENFYKLSWLPFLKLRASYGYTGNSNNSLSGKFLINYSSFPDPLTNLPFSSSLRAPNPDLKWEEVRIVNLGLDFQLFTDRISGGIELFSKRSKDVISNVSLPPSSGVSRFTLNYADMKSNGYEISLNTKNTRGRIEWTSNFGISRSKTIVTKISTSFGSKTSDFLYYQLSPTPGKIAYGISSYRWAGLDPATGDPLGYFKGQISNDYTAIFTDSLKNQKFHGSSLPLNSMFLRNNVMWKNFTISLNITGRFNYYFREPALTIDYAGDMSLTNYLADYYNRWQKPGDEATTNVPSMVYPSPDLFRNTFYQYAEIHVKRADNIRIQDIRLSYQWVNKRKNRMPFQSAQFFVYPNNLNLIIWRAENSHYDPDFVAGYSNPIAAPIPKTWTGGITINF